jgi:hypothetical protein
MESAELARGQFLLSESQGEPSRTSHSSAQVAENDEVGGSDNRQQNRNAVFLEWNWREAGEEWVLSFSWRHHGEPAGTAAQKAVPK